MLDQIDAYFKRMMHISHMDLESTSYLMTNLCTHPTQVYRSISWHRQTRGHWARDDPGFVAIQIVLMCVSSLAWGIGFSKGLGGIAKLIAWSVFVDYFFIGFVISTLCWLVATYVLSSSSSSPDSSQDSPLPSTLKEARRQQRHSSSSSNSNNNFSNGGGSRYGTPGGSVEWLYSFDVHCNGFFPVFIMTHVVQYVVAPLLFTGSFFSALLANALYGASYVYYFYVTFLGYQSLPFVKKADAFLYPAAVLALALVILTLFKFNTSLFLSNFYFGN